MPGDTHERPPIARRPRPWHGSPHHAPRFPQRHRRRRSRSRLRAAHCSASATHDRRRSGRARILSSAAHRYAAEVIAGSFEDAHALRDGQALAGADRIPGEEYDLIVVGRRASAASPPRISSVSPRPQQPNSHPRQPRRFRRPRQTQRIQFGWTAASDERRDIGNRQSASLRPDFSGPPEDFGHRRRGTHQNHATPRSSTAIWASSRALSLIERPSATTNWWSACRQSERLHESIVQAPISELRPHANRAARNRQKSTTCQACPSEEKKQRLSRMSYEAYLRDVVKAEPAVVTLLSRQDHG